DTVQDLVNKLNALGGDFSASLINSGGGSIPYRFSITSRITGSPGELLVDASQLDIRFQETATAQDALLLSGALDAPFPGALISSPSNDFSEVIDGVRLSVLDTSDKPQ